MRVLITGASGKCGTALRDLPCDKVFMDRKDYPAILLEEKFILGDINNEQILREAMDGCDAVIHLAHTWSHSWKSSAEVQYENTQSTYNLLKTAAFLGIERIIYASSAHIVGMYEIENAPDIYEIGNKVIVRRHSPTRPDSTYAMGKAIAELWGSYFAENNGPKFYAIRLGAVCDFDHDHPYSSAEEGVRRGSWTRGSDLYEDKVKRLKSKWLSRRDFVQLVYLCLQYDGPAFDFFYGISNNARRWLDIDYAKEVLGYRPQDNSEDWMNPPEPGLAKKELSL